MKSKYDLNEYELAERFDMLDPKMKVVDRLNIVALVGVLVLCIGGAIVNYCVRMLGEPAGMYVIYTLCGAVLTVLYMYLHELAHALAIVIVKHKRPKIKFGKRVASCGSPDIVYTKPQYAFVATFPLVLFCVVLIPLCVFLEAQFFVLPFMPLTYNVLGSLGDVYMVHRVMRSPRGCLVTDEGTEVRVYKRRVDTD